MEGVAGGLALPRPLDPPQHPDRVLAITGLDSSARLWPVQQTFDYDPTGLSPCSATTSRRSLPVLGPTGTVRTRYLARHAADCPSSIEPVELAYRVGLMGHSALPTTLDRAERFALMLFMRP
jgi:hypothetical protein